MGGHGENKSRLPSRPSKLMLQIRRSAFFMWPSAIARGIEIVRGRTYHVTESSLDILSRIFSQLLVKRIRVTYSPGERPVAGCTERAPTTSLASAQLRLHCI